VFAVIVLCSVRVLSAFCCLLSAGFVQPLALGGVLGAHQQALERMVVGDEWEIITPGAFAYGQ
jgi:hypothetical protein